MADMIAYMETNRDELFWKIQNRVFKKRDTFHVGTVTQVNTDGTSTIKSVRDTALTEVTAMNGEIPYPGANVLFLSGNEKTPSQILSLSPWSVGSHNLEA